MSTTDDHPSIPHDHPQRLLVVAYTRLFLLPECPDGSKLATIASFGDYAVRLIEMPSAEIGAKVAPLWVELYDGRSGRAVDCAGCWDLQDAGAATATFMDEAARLQARSSQASRPGDPREP